MKKLSRVVLILILILVLALTGCGGGSGGSGNPGGGNDGDGNPGGDSGGSSGYTGVAFTMVPVPSQSYEIAETEVTYELWYEVTTWAVANGYQFDTDLFVKDNVVGREGSSTNSDAPTAKKQHPVTWVSWYSAAVWCNALTEYYAAKGGTGYRCVYYQDKNYQTPIRSAGDSSLDNPYIYASATGNQDMAACTANGFRLPTIDEWYQAARYIDGTNCYPDDYASGADAAYDATEAPTDIDGDGDYRLTSDVARYSANSGGSTWSVKSKSPNKLGLYDMSGNVWEWCTDIFSGSTRYCRGGSWNYSNISMRLNAEDPVWLEAGSPYPRAYRGFRLARTN